MFDKEFLEIEIVWFDAHMLEISTKASNGRYSGIVETYTQDTFLQKFADDLISFPKTVSDSVLFESNYGMGRSSLSLDFRCVDGRGHTAVSVFMKETEKETDSPKEIGKVSLEISCSIQQIESFSHQILRMVKKKQGVAKLI